MATAPAASPVIVNPRQFLLDLAREHDLPELLQVIVTRLCESPAVCLARIWLVKPGAGCETCPMRQVCPDQTNCLHLVVSAGQSRCNPPIDYSRIDGDFRRFPIGVRKVGMIAKTAEAIEAPNLNEVPDWIARPEWLKSEGILGFGGQPLVSRGELLGVLAVFSRTTIGSACLEWLRMIADHAAAAISQARAWDQIRQLKQQLEMENEYLQEEVKAAQAFGELVGQSSAMQTIGRQIDLVAPTDASVLILGESGTGKELVAREIHRRSRRANRPLIKVNCAAIPRELYESEFFGHVRGSFTGAVRDRVGRFELAHGGTLFLDEVGEMPLDLQSKLLRVLQEGELERVGEDRTRRVDVRILAATNRNLRNEIEQGRFRSDLFYRLSVFPIELAPLRRHSEDIPLLAEHFLKSITRRHGRPPVRLTLAIVQQLQRYDWPGNVRELAHVLERSVITSPSGRLMLELPTRRDASQAPPPSPTDQPILDTEALRQFEAENIRRALLAAKGKVYGPEGAAAILGMKPTTLASRIKALKIRT